jgi:hypothetical protein
MVNTTSRKKAILASGIIAVAVVLAALVAYPASIGSANAEYVYALKENWEITEETSVTADSSVATIHT